MAHPTLQCPEISHNKLSPVKPESKHLSQAPRPNTFLLILLAMKRKIICALEDQPRPDTLHLLQATCGNSILTFPSPPCPQVPSSPLGPPSRAQWLVWGDHCGTNNTRQSLSTRPFKNTTLEPLVTMCKSGKKLVCPKPTPTNSGIYIGHLGLVSSPIPPPTPESQLQPSHEGAFLKHHPLCGA